MLKITQAEAMDVDNRNQKRKEVEIKNDLYAMETNPYFPDQSGMNNLIRDLGVTKQNPRILFSRLGNVIFWLRFVG